MRPDPAANVLRRSFSRLRLALRSRQVPWPERIAGKKAKTSDQVSRTVVVALPVRSTPGTRLVVGAFTMSLVASF